MSSTKFNSGVWEFLRIDNMSANEYSVLPESKDVLPDQQNAAKASTTVDYMSELDVLSRAARFQIPKTRQKNS